jgi:hypothetical protein
MTAPVATPAPAVMSVKKKKVNSMFNGLRKKAMDERLFRASVEDRKEIKLRELRRAEHIKAKKLEVASAKRKARDDAKVAKSLERAEKKAKKTASSSASASETTVDASTETEPSKQTLDALAEVRRLRALWGGTIADEDLKIVLKSMVGKRFKTGGHWKSTSAWVLYKRIIRDGSYASIEWLPPVGTTSAAPLDQGTFVCIDLVDGTPITWALKDWEPSHLETLLAQVKKGATALPQVPIVP